MKQENKKFQKEVKSYYKISAKKQLQNSHRKTPIATKAKTTEKKSALN